MNINITLLFSILAIIFFICSIWEWVLMYKRKAFKLLILSVLFVVLSYFFQALAVVALAIKITFYYLYWHDKQVRRVFNIQLIPLIIYLIILAILLMASANS